MSATARTGRARSSSRWLNDLYVIYYPEGDAAAVPDCDDTVTLDGQGIAPGRVLPLGPDLYGESVLSDAVVSRTAPVQLQHWWPSASWKFDDPACDWLYMAVGDVVNPDVPSCSANVQLVRDGSSLASLMPLRTWFVSAVRPYAVYRVDDSEVIAPSTPTATASRRCSRSGPGASLG